MRLLTGVAIDGRVVEMALPSDIPVAHLMPELLAALGTEDGRLKLRRVDGSWFDLERSLGDQGCVTGGVVSLEAPEVQSHGRHHDPVAELVERGPPVELIADSAVPAVIGAAATLASGAANADSVADFYRGKNVNVLIGVAVGGEYDLHARLVSRYLGKYIPGNPAVVPQNMTGAG